MHPHHRPQTDENRAPASELPSNSEEQPSKMFTQLPRLPQPSPLSFQPQYTENRQPYSPSTFSFQPQQQYAPRHSSPLNSSPLRHERSPLSSRTNTNHLSMSSPLQDTESNLQFGGSTSNPAASEKSKRVVKNNPLIHKEDQDGGRETRRKLFLKNVRVKSEDKRWEKMGGDDEILRTLYVADRHRAQSRSLREAVPYQEITEELEELEGMHRDEERQSWTRKMERDREEEMAEEVAKQEEAEVQAYLKMMESEQDEGRRRQNEADSPVLGRQAQMVGDEDEYGDAEYDAIFADVDMNEYVRSPQQGSLQGQQYGQRNRVPAYVSGYDDMDMS